MNSINATRIAPFKVEDAEGRPCTVRHKRQQIEFDDPASINYFLTLYPDGSKPFVVTAAAIREFGDRLILESYYELVRFAKAMHGIDYLQVFRVSGHREPLWFIEDGPAGAITALLPSDY